MWVMEFMRISPLYTLLDIDNGNINSKNQSIKCTFIFFVSFRSLLNVQCFYPDGKNVKKWLCLPMNRTIPVTQTQLNEQKKIETETQRRKNKKTLVFERFNILSRIRYLLCFLYSHSSNKLKIRVSTHPTNIISTWVIPGWLCYYSSN